MRETKIVCPKDGFNLFLVTREPDVGYGDPENFGNVCKKCEPKQFFEILRHARFIKLEEPAEPPKLKVQ